MSTVRLQLENLNKAKKRTRARAAQDETTILEAESSSIVTSLEVSVEHQNTSFGDSDQENYEPEVIFERGTTQKHALCLWHVGFRYTRKKQGSWFRCTQRDCPAWAKLTVAADADVLLGNLRKQHIHGPNPAKFLAEKKRFAMEEKIKEDPHAAKPSRMKAQFRAGTSDEVYEQMGCDDALDRFIQRKKSGFFKNVNIADPLRIQFPESLLTKDDGHNVLVFDSREIRPSDSNVIFVFAHPKLLDLLSQNARWSLDGTFKAAPTPWVQCFTIGCYVHRRFVTCAQALLPGKKSEFYIEALRAIGNAIAPKKPLQVMMDFESSMMKAVKTVFPRAVQAGCNFHFGQSIFRKARSLGIVALCGDTTLAASSARRTIRAVLALALIPPIHVRRAMALIIYETSDVMSPFLAYVASTYIGMTQFEMEHGAAAFTQHADDSINSAVRMSRSFSETPTRSTASLRDHDYTSSTANGFISFGMPSPRPSTPSIVSSLSRHSSMAIQRWELNIVKQPRFPVAFWSVYDRAQREIEKTNNAIEASHNQFAKDLNHHPSLSDFLQQFLDDIDKQYDISRSSAMHNEKKRRKQYILKEQAILEIHQRADFDSDQGLLSALNLLGLKLQGYFGGGLHVRHEERSDDDDSDFQEIV